MNHIKAKCASLLSILLITTLIGCSGSATQESTGDYIDDTWITIKVKASLVDDPSVKAREVNVETFKGVVQLSGFVESQEAMDRVVDSASSIEGVSSVQNNMTDQIGRALIEASNPALASAFCSVSLALPSNSTKRTSLMCCNCGSILATVSAHTFAAALGG